MLTRFPSSRRRHDELAAAAGLGVGRDGSSLEPRNDARLQDGQVGEVAAEEGEVPICFLSTTELTSDLVTSMIAPRPWTATFASSCFRASLEIDRNLPRP